MTLPIYAIKVVSTGTASSALSNLRTNSPTKSSWKITKLDVTGAMDIQFSIPACLCQTCIH